MCVVSCIITFLTACATVDPVDDAAVSGDAGGWGGARGLVHLMLQDDSVATGDTLDLAVTSIALVSDREPSTDQARTDLLRVHIDASGRDVTFDRVPPGLYSAIDIELAGDSPVLEATLHTPTRTFVIRTNAALSLSARCEEGQLIAVFGTLRVGVDFALGDLVTAVSRHPLPTPVDGVVVVDDTSAPEAIEDVRRTLAASIHAECGLDGV